MSRGLTGATQYYNQRLSEEVALLAARHPQAKIVEYKTNDTFTAVFGGKIPGSDEEFDYGLDYSDLEVVLTPPPRISGDPITIYQRCYAGDYDVPCRGADCICPNLDRAPYWDPEHPTSYLHCWVGYFIQKALYEAGMLDSAPLDMDTYKRFCEALNN